MSKKENYNYFKEFITVADYIVESANTLQDIIENFNIEKLSTDIHKVHRLENESDKVVHKMRSYLITDFLPPIDREDIALIIKRLDNIEDGIDEVLISIKILNITEIKIEILELIEILVKCCLAVKNIFLDLNNLKNIVLINERVKKVNKLEGLGDKVYEKLMKILYRTEADPITLIKWTNIYNCIEDTIDKCEELGDCIEDVVMKNS